MAKCGVVGKVRHGSEGVAIGAAIDLMARDNDPGHRPLNVYRCADCGDWHVGHRPRVLPVKKQELADVERIVSVTVHDSKRCACACEKVAVAVVETPRGSIACCAKHAKTLRETHDIDFINAELNALEWDPPLAAPAPRRTRKAERT